jgi:hypothetical protein
MNTNDLDHRDLDQDWRLQAEAERAEREHAAAGGDPRLDRYRLIVRALRQPLQMQLPADFAARVVAMAEQREQSDGFEDWLVVLLLLAMAIGGLLFVGPTLANVAHTMVGISMPSLPWHQLVMAMLCIGIVWALDRIVTLRGRTRMHPGPR